MNKWPISYTVSSTLTFQGLKYQISGRKIKKRCMNFRMSNHPANMAGTRPTAKMADINSFLYLAQNRLDTNTHIGIMGVVRDDNHQQREQR